MALNMEALPLHDDFNEYPLKADLHTIMSQQPLPVIPPGTVDPALMDGEEPTNQALDVLKTLNAALNAHDANILERCFFPGQAYWKDQLALTYHLRTFASPSVIAASLLETKILRDFNGGFEIKGEAHFTPVTPILQLINCELTFRTGSPAATCSGRLVLLPVRSEEQGIKTPLWKIWTLSTMIENLDIHPEDVSLLNSPGRSLDGLEILQTEVFIVGGGNAAITLAARLKAMGVDSIMADQNAHVGDNWALRYDCMRFHITTSACELPYMVYPNELQSPHLLTKDELAEHVRSYVRTFNLNIITSAKIVQTSKLPDKRWKVQLQTLAGRCTVIAKHLVQATGIGSQKPHLPPMSDENLYAGISIHSTQYKNANDLIQRGASSILVVGSANTAFDVLEDLHAAGLKPTMVVRSPTYMIPIDYACHKHAFGVYNNGVEAADKLFMTLPIAIDAQIVRNLFAHLASQEPDRYSALAAAGFPVLDSRNLDAGLLHYLFERGGGHYVDTGATALIAEGKAGIKAGVEPVAYTATGLRFSDGSTIDADAVIWCTGFSDKNVRHTVAEILKVELPVDATWGLDQEGEIRGMWKRHLRVENFWVMGGDTSRQRWYSRTLALQIKAALEGILPPAYRGTPQPNVLAKSLT